MSGRLTPLRVHRRYLADLVSLGCILLFWLLVAEATSILVRMDPIGAIGWAEVPTYAFLLAASVNAIIYLAARLASTVGSRDGSVSS